MPLPPFVLVTANPGKLVEARRLAGHAFDAAAVDLPEIQSLDLAEVLRAKAEAAWERLGRPLVVEDSGLELAALNGFPGPLIKWLLTAVGAEGIARIAAALGDVRATARCMLFYKDGGTERIAEGVTAGTLVLPGRGTHGFGWDPVFLPEGGDQTFAELDGPEKDAVSHRGKAWREMIGRLAEAPPG